MLKDKFIAWQNKRKGRVLYKLFLKSHIISPNTLYIYKEVGRYQKRLREVVWLLDIGYMNSMGGMERKIVTLNTSSDSYLWYNGDFYSKSDLV